MRDCITQMMIDTRTKSFGSNKWGQRHCEAWDHPTPLERALRDLIVAWKTYAEAHKAKHGAPVGDDFYTGEHWTAMGESLVYMLSCDFGSRFDGGTLDKLLRDIATLHGCTLEN